MVRPIGPIANALLVTYKVTLSPLLALFGARCRHMPSCSEYGAEAVSRHGVWYGAWMALARFQRCRPGGSSGYDPVPEHIDRAPLAPWRAGDWASGERRVPEPDQKASP